MSEMAWLDWHGCYGGGWKGLVVPEAFQHPAKFSRRLVERIVRFGLAEGYWRPGDLVGDPFGGVGLGGIVAAYEGLRWLGVELESKFVATGNANFELHRRAWETLGVAAPVLVQGDSRGFAGIVREVLAGAVTSPPYAGLGRDSGTEHHPERMEGSQAGASLKRSMDAVVMSPPYVSGGHHADQTGAWGGIAGERQRHEKDAAGYGGTEGQIGKLKEGEIDGAMTSPPYMHGAMGGQGPLCEEKGCDTKYGEYDREGHRDPETGRYLPSQNIGLNRTPETYWSAMATVYQQMHLALRPNGVACVVLKDFVRRGERVQLCDQTAALLHRLGFDVFLRCRAWLTRQRTERLLDGTEVVRETSRKSFFRRIAESKGSPRIDFEECLWCRRP